MTTDLLAHPALHYKACLESAGDTESVQLHTYPRLAGNWESTINTKGRNLGNVMKSLLQVLRHLTHLCLVVWRYEMNTSHMEGVCTHHSRETCWRSPHCFRCSWGRCRRSRGLSWHRAGQEATRTIPACHEPSANCMQLHPPTGSDWAAAMRWCCWSSFGCGQWSCQSAPGNAAHSGRTVLLPTVRERERSSYYLWRTLLYAAFP